MKPAAASVVCTQTFLLENTRKEVTQRTPLRITTAILVAMVISCCYCFSMMEAGRGREACTFLNICSDRLHKRCDWSHVIDLLTRVCIESRTGSLMKSWEVMVLQLKWSKPQQFCTFYWVNQWSAFSFQTASPTSPFHIHPLSHPDIPNYHLLASSNMHSTSPCIEVGQLLWQPHTAVYCSPSRSEKEDQLVIMSSHHEKHSNKKM